MIRIVETRRLGLTVFIATILVPGRTLRQSVHMSEQGARAWVQRELTAMGARAA